MNVRNVDRMGREEWQAPEIAGCEEWRGDVRESSQVVAACARERFCHMRQGRSGAITRVDARWPVQDIEHVLHADALAARVDVVADWLGDVLPRWNAVPRLDMLICELFAVDSDSALLSQWMGQYLTLGLIQRTLEPGCYLEELPLLLGPQGCGETTSVRALLPSRLRHLYSDRADFAASGRDLAETVQGIAVAEVADVVLTGPDWVQSRIKRQLSSATDWVRLAYRYDPQHVTRRFIVVGTGDDYGGVGDDRDARRFVPIWLDGRGAGAAYIEAHHDQLFADAPLRGRRTRGASGRASGRGGRGDGAPRGVRRQIRGGSHGRGGQGALEGASGASGSHA